MPNRQPTTEEVVNDKLRQLGEALMRIAAPREQMLADEEPHEEDCPATDGFGCRCGEAADLMTDDTARVETALRWLEQYRDGLDEFDLCPNGDDWNRTVDGVVSILRDGVERKIVLKTAGR